MRDLVIIGAGPAGLSAAVYAKRAGLDAVLVDETSVYGGQVLSTYEVDNYLGLPGISGMELGEKFASHARNTGIETVESRVLSIDPLDKGYAVRTESTTIETKAIVVATGARHALLGVPGESDLAGMGVSYCATCDGAFFRNREVCVVGGSDVAVEDAIYLARACKKVYLIHRRDTLRAAHSLVEEINALENVEFVWDSEVTKINGNGQVDSVSVHNKKTNEDSEIKVQGVFIAVGINPVTELVDKLGAKAAQGGYIEAGEDCRTSVKGIYVAGDIRKKPMRQIITAVADGANAVQSVQVDLAELNK